MKTFKHIDGEIAPDYLVHYRDGSEEDGSMTAALLKRFRSKHGLPINFAVKI